ncbi:MAG: 1-acyl-sn-glycerol-3-phosphate acyltransferase [Phycisphaeraceae bacterium]|nr:1-acyl-sn-glycerol-3-phosphate acyltransferase [Phycisphaeraceae bacterium]
MSPPTLAIWIVAGIAAWILLWMWFTPRATRWIRSTLDARIGDGPLVGAIDLASCCYCRWVHRVRFEGFDRLPETFRHGGAGGGVVVANHTAGMDPMLVQTGLRRLIRWMMWADMMTPALDCAWKAGQVLPVSHGQADSTTLRKAVRHVKQGGIIGLFPEGAIARPPGELRPFQPGVGLLARLTRAPVLVLWIHDTPYTETAWGSLARTSRAVVEFVDVLDLSKEKDPAVASEMLRDAIARRSGWPRNEESMLEPETATEDHAD